MHIATIDSVVVLVREIPHRRLVKRLYGSLEISEHSGIELLLCIVGDAEIHSGDLGVGHRSVAVRHAVDYGDAEEGAERKVRLGHIAFALPLQHIVLCVEVSPEGVVKGVVIPALPWGIAGKVGDEIGRTDKAG